jgi:hypothetical protein
MNTLVGLGIIVLGSYLGTTQTEKESTREKIHTIRKEAVQLKVAKEQQVSREYAGRGKSALFYVQQKRQTMEKKVRNILEVMFNEKFPNVRPKWLINPKTGRRLEIDCYCESLRLAVEFSGSQHYEFTPYYHKNGFQDFVDMKERDLMKAVMIRQRGVDLIIIPYTVKEDDLETYILEQVYKVRGHK